MNIAELKDICDTRKIRRIAIVDDVFDVPEPTHIDRKRYSNFCRKYNADKNLKQALASISGTQPQNLPGFNDLEEDDLAPLWNCVWEVHLGKGELKTEYINTLRDLFRRHSDGVLEMLDTRSGPQC